MKGWIVAAVLIGLIASFAGGIWAGISWADGHHAKAALATTTGALNSARKDLTDYHTQLQQASQQFETDAEQLRGIAEDYANGRNDQQAFYAAHDSKLEQFLASHPDLAACDIGPVGLGLWNAANRGPAAAAGPAGAGSAAAADRPEPLGGVSAAAAGLLWKIAGPRAQPPAGDGAVPRLPAPPRGSGQGGKDQGSTGRGAAAARAREIWRHSKAALIEATQGIP